MKDKKGFTLAELLIVVAIIGVLVAISIPIFMGQMNKAKYGADEANARSIYSILAADYLTNEGNNTATVTKNPASFTDGTSYTITVAETDGTSNVFKFSGIVDVTVTASGDTAPSVTIAACSKAGHATAQTFPATA